MYTSYMDSPVGKIYLKSSEKGLSSISIGKKQSFGEENIEKENEHIKLAKEELCKYFQGQLKEFSVSLDLKGTDFQKKIWLRLLKIPYGELRTYAEIAETIGGRKYSRAVGSANKANPIPIIVPCHRVIRMGRRISNYSGGLDVQRFLFEVEGIQYDDITYINKSQSVDINL